MKKLFFFSSFLAFFFAAFLAEAEDTIGIHKTNFYIFNKGGEPYMPFTANVGYLMNPSLPDEAVSTTLEQLAVAGIDTIRVVIDDAYQLNQPLKTFEAPDGSLQDSVLSRLELILDISKQCGMYTILCLFDIQKTAERWVDHPSNRKNGGNCADLSAYLTQSTQLKRFASRVTQVVSRYKDENILAWELGRGVNIWELNTPPDNDLIEPVKFWILRTVDWLRRADNRNHLIALSYAPNTLPISLMQFAPIQINLLQIHSGNSLQAAVSLQSFIQTARTLKKPIFVAETHWKGKSSQRDEFTKNQLWVSIASCSSMFLSPVKEGDNVPHFASADLVQFKHAKAFCEHINIGGVPRPPSPAPIQIKQHDSYIVIESLVGNDWLFWGVRKDSGDDQLKLTFHTVEGKYEVLWFDTVKGSIDQERVFRLVKKQISMVSPPFEHDIAGRLRFIERLKLENKDK